MAGEMINETRHFYQDRYRQATTEAEEAYHSSKKQGANSRTGSLPEAQEEAGGLLQARKAIGEV